MGFLRKVGRRIKKRIKKLFSSKIGRVLGTVGLYFALGAAAKGLTGWLSSKFGAAASGAATDATTTAVVEGAAADATTTAVVEGAGSTVSNSITTAGTNMEAANNAIAAVDASGASTATNTITEAVELFSDEKVLNDTIGTVSNSLQEQKIMPDLDFTPSTPELPDSESLLNPSFKDVDTFGDKFRVAKRETKDYFLGEDSTFVPDTITQLGTGAITSAFQEEEEQMGMGRMPAQRQVGEAAQAAHIQDVSAQLPQYAGVNPNQLNQNLFYGTLSPQF